MPLTRQALWWDEGYSILLASRSVKYIIDSVATDPHPAGYYLLLHLFTGLAGYSTLAVRFLSVMTGTLAIPLMYQTSRQLFGRWVALLSALLLAVSPFHVGRSQDARMYPLVVLLSLLSLYFMVRLLQPGHKPRLRLLWAGYVFATAAGLFVHYYVALYVIAQTVFVLGWRRRILRCWLVAQVVVLIVLAPWLVYQGPKMWRYINEKVSLERATSQDVVTYWRNYLSVIGQGYLFNSWMTLLVVVVLAVGLIRWGRKRHRESLRQPLALCLVLFIVPVMIGFLCNIRWPYEGFPRILSPALVPLTGLMAVGVIGLGGLGQRRGSWLVLLVLFAGAGYSLSGYYRDITETETGEDYRPVIRDMQHEITPKDAILFEHPWQVGYFLAYAPNLLPQVYYVPDAFSKPSKETQRIEALRAVWEGRKDVRDAYSLGNGWSPDHWQEAMEDWWSQTSEATAVKGDVVGLAYWSYGYLPSTYKIRIEEIMQQHGRLWYPAFQIGGDTSGRDFDLYLTRTFRRLYTKDFGNHRLILFAALRDEIGQ